MVPTAIAHQILRVAAALEAPGCLGCTPVAP